METVSYTITLARAGDVPLLPAIELAAARLFEGYAPESLLTQTTSEQTLRLGQRRGLLWVALADDKPVGFALVDQIEPQSAHLEELDVHTDHMRRGLGSRLVTTVCDWAAEKGFDAVTLNTARDVWWNMPFYERLGFKEVPRDEWTPALRRVFATETNRGLDPTRRLVMRRRTASR
ncbi:MAG TPA: GNAT family N-acetyltransferase [Gemmatimonadaceae bacterium]|jgi:GNAT superfamily N-acetyltransferase|nr:GNAT family N-acetyltransferase [Gemmatimonadaceae bacterium]